MGNRSCQDCRRTLILILVHIISVRAVAHKRWSKKKNRRNKEVDDENYVLSLAICFMLLKPRGWYGPYRCWRCGLVLSSWWVKICWSWASWQPAGRSMGFRSSLKWRSLSGTPQMSVPNPRQPMKLPRSTKQFRPILPVVHPHTFPKSRVLQLPAYPRPLRCRQPRGKVTASAVCRGELGPRKATGAPVDQGSPAGLMGSLTSGDVKGGFYSNKRRGRG